MKRFTTVCVLCSGLLLTASPAHAVAAGPVRVDLESVLSGVLGLLIPEEPTVQGSPPPRAVQPLRVESTAYCLTGTMASGKPVYEGAAAMNGVPLGTRYRVRNGPRAGEVFTIEDRIGHSSQFDIAYPGDCEGAVRYGRRTVSISPAA